MGHRAEDVDEARTALTHLQLTWKLYVQLGRPANLAEAIERQIEAVARAFEKLGGGTPFTITVPVMDET